MSMSEMNASLKKAIYANIEEVFESHNFIYEYCQDIIEWHLKDSCVSLDYDQNGLQIYSFYTNLDWDRVECGMLQGKKKSFLKTIRIFIGNEDDSECLNKIKDELLKGVGLIDDRLKQIEDEA